MSTPGTAETIAQRFHEAYERLAPAHGYETRPDSAVPWPDVPERNRRLMTAVVGELLAAGVINAGGGDRPPTARQCAARAAAALESAGNSAHTHPEGTRALVLVAEGWRTLAGDIAHTVPMAPAPAGDEEQR